MRETTVSADPSKSNSLQPVSQNTVEEGVSSQLSEEIQHITDNIACEHFVYKHVSSSMIM